MNCLQKSLGVAVEPVETVGWSGDALEAQVFGFLAARSLQKNADYPADDDRCQTTHDGGCFA